MQPLVSVIIPVYNVADYLGACLESVCQQTYTNLEIILIDDGSTDGSLDKVRDLIQADARVRVLIQTNQGAAAARNRGLDEAKGDYILFVDADDWVTPDAVASLYALTQEFQTKLAVGGVAYHRADGGVDRRSTYPRGGFSTKEVVAMMFTDHPSILLGAGRLFHRDLVESLRFPVGKLVEDAFFQPQLYLLAGTIALDPKPLYHYYYQRSGNASSKFSVKKYQDRMEGLAVAFDLFKDDEELVQVMLGNWFAVRQHFLASAIRLGDRELAQLVNETYWTSFSQLTLPQKGKVLKGYLTCFVLVPLQRHFSDQAWYQALRDQKRIYQREASNRRLRWPAFKAGLAQIKRVGHYAYTVGRYIQVPDVPVCYLDNAKVASTSIKEALLVANGGSVANLFKNDIHIHFSQYFVRPIEPGVALPDFSFVFVRNPFERVVSTYKNMYHSKKVWSTFKVYLFGYFKKDRGFDYFVRKGPVQISDKWADTHLVSQHVLVYGPEGQCYADFIGRFEHLAEDWKEVQQRVALPDLPVRNQTAKSDWRDYYTLELAQLVYQRYQKDVEVFGYQDAYRDLVTYLEEKEKSSAGL